MLLAHSATRGSRSSIVIPAYFVITQVFRLKAEVGFYDLGFKQK